MARVELIMPKMGESVSEATIISWSKKIGDMVELDETIIEIATDKVDSEVPSTHQGKLVEMLFGADDVVKVGEPFAIIETEAGENDITAVTKPTAVTVVSNPIEEVVTKAVETTTKPTSNSGDRFYSPLVRSMASQEKIAIAELDTITGTGKDDRVTKSDMLVYLQNRGSAPKITVEIAPEVIATQTEQKAAQIATTSQNRVNIPNTGDTEIVEMDRMRKLISAHMTMSKQTSAHITSFVEADMTNVVNWRDSIKDDFKRREGQNITFTPIIIEAMAKAVKDFPMVNVSVDGTNIHIHKNVNIGMAAALPDGNLIVPVIKECQNKNLIGITKSVNDLATRARAGQLKPDDIQGGTITMTNVGTFGNLMGTPIINQPQVAILACGVIKKKPVV
ncbi:MAG: diapophytoene dehydrogenase, partial [Cryomorphaceae bacterium BACL11 MAG-121001-bin54]